VKTTRPSASSANSFRPDLSGRFKREMPKLKRLFVQLNIILPWNQARREEEIQFSLFVHFCFSFFGWHFYAEPKTPKTGETKSNEHLVKSRAFERWHCWILCVSVSLTGIVKLPLFKRRTRGCVRKLLVRFLIHNFVIWCIFLFPIFSFCIEVAGAQTCSRRGKSSDPGP